MSETFGAALRRLRGDLTLKRLSAIVTYSTAYLSELERDKKKPTMAVAKRCDDALNAGGLLIAFVYAVTTEPIPEQAISGDDEAGHVPIKELAMTADESARFTRRAGLSANAELVDQWDAEVRDLAIDFVTRPPYAVYRPIATLRREVFTILDSHVRPEYLTDLYLIAGKTTALLAHACADLGQPAFADAHARSAWLCADLAGSNPLKTYVKWVQSNVAYWSKDYVRAAELAEAGMQYATQGSNKLRLLSQQARAWAALGNARAVHDALDAARTERDALPISPTEDGVMWFNPGKAAYYSADALLTLGGRDNAQLALSEASEAMDLFQAEPDPCHELVAAAELDFVTAHLALDDADAAQEALPAVLDLPSERRTVPVISRVGKIRDDLNSERFENASIAADLHERIALFLAYPAVRELTT